MLGHARRNFVILTGGLPLALWLAACVHLGARPEQDGEERIEVLAANGIRCGLVLALRYRCQRESCGTGRQALEQVAREVAARYEPAELRWTRRNDVEGNLTAELAKRWATDGLRLDALSIRNVIFPAAFQGITRIDLERPPPKDLELRVDKALAQMWREKCSAGDLRACAKLGTLYRDGRGVSRDCAHAVALVRRACDGGNAFGCAELGMVYFAGSAGPREVPRALALVRQACDGGSRTGCRELGLAYAKGLGVARDPHHALELFRQSCSSGDAASCSDLGIGFLQGEGVASDPRYAVTLLGKGCDGEDGRGCAELAHAYATGNGVDRDLDRAANLLTRACDLHLTEACLQLAKLYEAGMGVAQDADRAAALRRQARAESDRPSCGGP